jgi:DNA-binding NarL/FixJ family response regulator
MSRAVRVCFIDDDLQEIKEFARGFDISGNYQVSFFSDPVEAANSHRNSAFDLAIVDLYIPGVDKITSTGIKYNALDSGLFLARHFVSIHGSTKCVVLSSYASDTVDDFARKAGNIVQVFNKSSREYVRLVHCIDKIFDLKSVYPRSFVVHGRDKTLLPIIRRVAMQLNWAEPTVLDETPGTSKTVIEKFESETEGALAAFVFATPDDEGDYEIVVTSLCHERVRTFGLK